MPKTLVQWNIIALNATRIPLNTSQGVASASACAASCAQYVNGPLPGNASAGPVSCNIWTW